MMGSERSHVDALERAVQQARAALSRDPRKTLERGFRELIWTALGPMDDAGRRRRATLAIMATEHVLPSWNRVFPRDRQPEELLEVARAVLREGIDRKRAEAERGNAWTAMDDLASTTPAAVVAVGYAAAQAVRVALYDESFDPASVDPDRMDVNVDPEDLDSSYLASMAASDGPPWSKSSDATKRYAYWEWWLREAVPAANAVAH